MRHPLHMPRSEPAAAERPFRSAFLCIPAAMCLASPALAARSDVSHRLEQRATRACRGDALRFCPGRLSSKAAAARCLSTKRSKLTPACRRAYDDVAHALKR